MTLPKMGVPYAEGQKDTFEQLQKELAEARELRRAKADAEKNNSDRPLTIEERQKLIDEAAARNQTKDIQIRGW